VSFVIVDVLIAAAATQNDIVIKYLHGICGRVDCRNALGITPLHATARFGRRTTCDLLLGLGAQMPTHFPSPLDLACFHGHVDVVNFLIEKGALTCATPRKTHTDTLDSLQGHINMKRFGFSYRDSEAHMRNWRESPLKGLINSGYWGKGSKCGKCVAILIKNGVTLCGREVIRGAENLAFDLVSVALLARADPN
jgi:ankyrin repeat protein